ncbi:MAG TPA: hypothetical protein PKC30_14935 [Saprospiraceae bacterium]|nr:hypothetical protein [Saprospiraceae bacterium]
MQKSFSSFLLIVFLVIVGCKSSPLDQWDDLNLLGHGIPVTIKAPAGSEVGKDDFGFMQGVWIKGENYHVQIYSSVSNTLDIDRIKQQKLREVKANRYFSKIIEEDKNGFLYEKDIDGDIRIDFIHIKIIGDKEITFQKGLTSTFSESEIRNMYASVQ